jgi:molybdate transport system permease protein
MIDSADLMAIWITFKLALVTTILLLLIGIPLAWWLARTRSRFRVVVESVVALPLVLPPTVLGFYLLIFMGPNGPLGRLVGSNLVFTFQGLVIASMIFSLPFVVQPLRGSFLALSSETLEAAATLGADPLDRFWTIVLPLARPGLLSASVLGFAHTVGEFGVALMIGGSIPGSTKVVSIAIYDHVEALQYPKAHVLSLGLLIFSFVTLMIVYTVNRRTMMVRP